MESIKELLTKVKEVNLRSTFEQWKIFKEEVKMKAIERSSETMFAVPAEEDILPRQLQIFISQNAKTPETA